MLMHTVQSLLRSSSLLVFGFVLSGAYARAGVVVSGLADIWLAGQPNGSTVVGAFGSDSAPDSSPTLVPVIAGHTLTFSGTGQVSNENGICFSGPDGGCYLDVADFGAGPENGISSYNGPANARIGVSGSGTIGLDFILQSTGNRGKWRLPSIPH